MEHCIKKKLDPGNWVYLFINAELVQGIGTLLFYKLSFPDLP